MKISIDKLLDILDSRPLSVLEFKKLANTATFLLFTDLLDYTSFDDIFAKNGDKILLIIKETPNFGHYCILMKGLNNSVIFYDSYGLKHSDIIDKFPETQKILEGRDPLKILEKNSSYTLDRNSYKHQADHKKNDLINTCGFHSVFRSKFNFLSNDEYNDLVNSSNINIDDLVILVSLTNALELNLLEK